MAFASASALAIASASAFALASASASPSPQPRPSPRPQPQPSPSPPPALTAASEERRDAWPRRRLGSRSLLRGWLRRGRRLGIRCRGGSLAEDVREGSGGIAARRIGGRRRRRRRRGDGGVIGRPRWTELGARVVIPRIRGHPGGPRALVIVVVRGQRSRLRLREVRRARRFAPAAWSSHLRLSHGGAHRARSNVFIHRGVAAPRRRLLRAGRPRSRTRMVELLRCLHPRRSFIASTRHPRPRPSEPRRSRPEYKCYFEKSRICCRCQIGACAGWQVFGWALITTE